MKHDDLIFDVGMHRGEDTDYYLKKGFRVVGFEADPAHADYCRDRFAEEIRDGRVVIIEGAIVENVPGEPRPSTIRFFTNRESSIMGTVVDERVALNETLGFSHDTVEVNAVDFAGCLAEHGVPHYMKIDIEGMDSVCLRAMLGLDHVPDYLSVESDKSRFDNLVGEFELLSELGYDNFKLVQQSGASRHKEPNPSQEGSYAGHVFEDGSSGPFGRDLPGRWLSRAAALNRYRFIFLQYKLFGKVGIVSRFYVGKRFRNALIKVLRKPIPGWYDTHARHSSVAS